MNNHLQCVVLGEGAVGKSALTIQNVKGVFVDEYDPTIEDSYSKQIGVDGKVYQLDVLDTAGQEEYSAMREAYMADGEGFVVVYAINNRDSFEEVPNFVSLLERVKDENARDIPIVLVGNKVDLEEDREVSRDEGAQYARMIGAPFIECSAFTRVNVNKPFEEMVRRVMVARAKADSASSESEESRRRKKLPLVMNRACNVL